MADELGIALTKSKSESAFGDSFGPAKAVKPGARLRDERARFSTQKADDPLSWQRDVNVSKNL